MRRAVVCGRRLDHPAVDRAEPRYPIPRCHDARDCDLASCGAHLRRWADHVARQRLDARLAELDDTHAISGVSVPGVDGVGLSSLLKESPQRGRIGRESSGEGAQTDTSDTCDTMRAGERDRRVTVAPRDRHPTDTTDTRPTRVARPVRGKCRPTGLP